jgi:predicted HicB family RNase H-like nuclease
MAAKKKRPPGRPRLAPGESRQETVTLRVRSEDAERMRMAADSAGLSFSAWARKILTEAAGK